jgi:hypothetical protein
LGYNTKNTRNERSEKIDKWNCIKVEKLLQSKGNNKQSEKPNDRMGDNI